MFYPAPDIDKIMPDMLVPAIDKKMGSNHKTCMDYFTRPNKIVKELSETKKENKALENIVIEETFESTKGVLPVDMMMHPSIQYNYRGENVVLNGLESSSNHGVVNNGTWRP